VEDEGVSGELAVDKGADEVELAEVNGLFEEEAPCWAFGALCPDADDERGGTGYAGWVVAELEEVKVEVLIEH
jgi:hypothetical protein